VNDRYKSGWAGVALLVSLATLSGATLLGQSRTGDTIPRTPWGAPDLQGVWTGSSLTPLERPRDLEGREFLTPAEAADLEARAAGRRVDAAPRAGDPGTYNQFWFDPGTTVIPGGRTALITDPPNGRIPFTEAGREHSRVSSARYGVGPRDSYVDLDTGERCLTDGLPLRYSGYNANYQIFQTADHVAILGEMFRDLRIITLDDQPAPTVPQWLGEGRGRWDGDTLVVETRSFADKGRYWWATAWRASRPSLRLVERFTRIDAETLDYEFTMEDPEMFAQPWTAMIPLTTNQASRGVTNGPLFEYACHEGNYGLTNVLAGARTLDLEAETGAAR